MKKTFLLVALQYLFFQALVAQAPTAVNYQAIARNSDGSVVANQSVRVQFNIRAGTAEGANLYTENHNTTTNEFGLFTLKLGQGIAINGRFSDIDWSQDRHFLNVLININNSGNLVDIGTSELLSVPYALFANEVASPINIKGENGSRNLYLSSRDPNVISPANPNHGYIGVFNELDNRLLVLTSTANGYSGTFELYHKNGEPLIQLTNTDGDTGYLGIMDTLGNTLVQISKTANDQSGFLSVKDTSGQDIILLTSDTEEGAGVVATNHPNGQLYTLASSVTGGNNGGFFGTYGPNGVQNCRLSSLSTNVNHGFISVYGSTSDGPTDGKAGIYVDAAGQGIVFGDTKSFRMKHPGQPGKEIWYASLEGPEAAAYLRGTAQLKDGEARVAFSDHFRWVANEKTMTVILTPLSSDSKGLAVTNKGQEGFSVKELFNGYGNYEFDWEVKAVRKGYEDYRVVRDEAEVRQSETKTTKK